MKAYTVGGEMDLKDKLNRQMQRVEFDRVMEHSVLIGEGVSLKDGDQCLNQGVLINSAESMDMTLKLKSC